MHTHFLGMKEGRDCRFGGRGWGRGERPEGFEREEHGEGGRESRGHRHGGPGRGFFGRGFGEGRGRMFEAGDVKLVILKLLSEQPSYGYQLIKTMEQRLSGGYAPSPGVIYPTLTMLEEEGLATASTENNKKVYSVTPEGQEFLAANGARIEGLFERLEETGRGFERGRSPELMKAFMNLREAVATKVWRGTATPEQLKKITEAIHAAAKAIDEA
jgi:DNA-binding PadR family transcriptional regulator